MKQLYISILMLSASVLQAQETTTKRIYFDTNQSVISPKSSAILDSLVSSYKNSASGQFDIEGYTDEVGGKKFNLLLSKKRAHSVYLYLKNKGVDTLKLNTIGLGINKAISENHLQRNVTVTLRSGVLSIQKNIAKSSVRKDTINLDGRYFQNIQGYTDTESMIKHRMFAIDSSETIIRTAGMVSFELNENFRRAQLQNSESYVKVCLPLPKNEKYDPEMKIWLITKNKRWVESKIPIEYNKDSKEYCCYLPCMVLGDFNGVNIDRRINERELLASVATFRNFNFYEVELTRSSFSAITEKNEIEWNTFVTENPASLPTYYFRGKFKDKGKEKVLHFQLSKAEFTGNLTTEARYYLTKKSNYFIDDKEYNKKGFWAWVKRIFEKES